MNDKEYTKAGLWYVVATFFSSALNIATTPVFTRLLSVEDYGMLGIYNTWYSILTVIVTLNAFVSIQIVKVRHDSDNSNYVSTVMTLSTVSSFILFAIVTMINQVAHFISLDSKFMIVMIIEIVAKNVYNIWTTHRKVYLKYKSFTITSICSAFIGTITSLVFVIFGKMGVYGKIIGQTIPFVLLTVPIVISVYRKSERIFEKKYVKEILEYCLPLVPHVLSGFVLSGFDKVIIESLEDTSTSAIYSLGYSYCSLLSFFVTAVNGAWVVWLFDSIKQNQVKKIREVSKTLTTLLFVTTVGMITVAPEAIAIFGGEKYTDSVYVVPPILIGLFLNFVYTYYVNIEFYNKETTRIAAGTIVSAIINIILNYIFIPIYGYGAAAYTTLVSYAVLYIFHYNVSKKIDKCDYFCDRYIIISIIALIPIAIFFVALYKYTYVRYIICIIIVAVVACTYIKCKGNSLRELISAFKKKE